MISSVLLGFQSVILLMVLTRTVGLADSGIFTLAYANASLFLLIGKYGVRNYQVSDVHEEHSFQDYKTARYLSIAMMIFSAVVYLIYNFLTKRYTIEKGIIILFMCLLKVPDALEDVYFGEFQRKGRLDVAAKTMSVRLIFVIILFSVTVTLTKNLMIALFITVIVSFLLMIVFLKWDVTLFDLDGKIIWNSVWLIIKDCFPLFAGFFLSQYIGNAPKYAIDAQMGDEIQACYGFISMPVFVIGLFSNMIYHPIIHKMADQWINKKIKIFFRRFMLQVAIVLGITGVCMIGAYIIGIPVLSVLYHTNLLPYKNEFLILLAGGGFLALAGLLNITITIMRLQYYLLIGYAFVAFMAFVFSNKVVSVCGITGAAWIYTISMGILFSIFAFIFTVGLQNVWKVNRIKR